MKKYVLKLTVILMFGLFATTTWSSNIQIFERPTMMVDPGNSNFNLVRFGLSWDYSWRTVDPNNWDAAWVFVKFRVGSGAWDHMYLDYNFTPTVGNDNGNAMSHEYGSSFVPGVNGDRNRAVGVFLYRKDYGRGDIVWEDITLRWNRAEPGIYHSTSVLATDEVTIRVFAIEMVYVPQGPFFLGSGNTSLTTHFGEFTRADVPGGAVNTVANIGVPYLVENENAISVRARPNVAGFVDANGVLNNHAGPVRPGGLSTTSNSFAINTAQSIGLLGEDEAGIPSAFPKGFRAFYVMKYEISQGGYVDFLNTLTLDQQTARTRGITATSPSRTRAMQQTNASDRNWIIVVRQGVIEFGVDLNNNGIPNQDDDGENIANAMNAFDLMTYMDFAGLRPMTELEFEKASRGPRDPIPGEFVWGSVFYNTHVTALNVTATAAAFFYTAGTIGRANERPAAPFINHLHSTGGAIGQQAAITRNGAFADENSGRMTSGATYWGIMEMGNNLWELTIGVANASGRGFTGQHGDGRLTPGGFHNVTGWPIDHLAWGLRGASAAEAITSGHHGLSARSNAYWAVTGILNTVGGAGNSWNVGGRGVRTAHTQNQLP